MESVSEQVGSAIASIGHGFSQINDNLHRAQQNAVKFINDSAANAQRGIQNLQREVAARTANPSSPSAVPLLAVSSRFVT
jgi:hypothetical protein